MTKTEVRLAALRLAKEGAVSYMDADHLIKEAQKLEEYVLAGSKSVDFHLPDPKDVRSWAQEHGLPITKTGALPKATTERYIKEVVLS